MSCGRTTAELDQEIADTKTDIANTRAALTAVLTGAQQYTIDTGQTRQTVNRANLSSLRLMLNSLKNDLAVLEAIRCRSGSFYGRPSF